MQRQPTDPPDALDPSELASLRAWCQRKGFTEAHLQRAIEIVFDWARSNGKRKHSWPATIRNAMLPQNGKDAWVGPDVAVTPSPQQTYVRAETDADGQRTGRTVRVDARTGKVVE